MPKEKTEKKPKKKKKVSSEPKKEEHNAWLCDTEAAKGRFGRRPKYDPKHHPPVCAWMHREGASVLEVCAEFGISTSTYYNWCDKYTKFLEATRITIDLTNKQVENALLKKCLGYREEYTETYTEKEAIAKSEVVEMGLDDACEWVTVTKKIHRKVKIVDPDVPAIKFWLVNRDKDRWKSDKIKLNVSGATDDKPVEVKHDLTGLSMDELIQLEHLVEKLDKEPKNDDSK